MLTPATRHGQLIFDDLMSSYQHHLTPETLVIIISPIKKMKVEITNN